MALTERVRSRLRAVPARTMAIWLALIVVVFVTRNRWEAWVVDCELPEGSKEYNGLAVLYFHSFNRVVLWGAEEKRTIAEFCSPVSPGDLPTAGSSDGERILLSTGHRDAPDPDSLEDGAAAGWPRQLRPAEPVILEPATGRHITLKGHTGPVGCGEFSHDDRLVATGSADGTVRLWDARTGEQLRIMRGHEGMIRDVSFSPDGSLMVTAGDDGTVRLWDARTARQVAVLESVPDCVNGVVFMGDRGRVVGLCPDACHVWDADSARLLMSLKDAEGNIDYSVEYGGLAVAVGKNGEVRLADMDTGSTRVVREAPPPSPTGLVLIPYGEPTVTPEAEPPRPTRVLFSPDGKRFLVALSTRRHELWDAERGRLILELTDPVEIPYPESKFILSGSIPRVGFAPGGERVATSFMDDHGTRIWCALTGRVLARLRDCSFGSFLEDGRMLGRNIDGDDRIYRRIRPEYWWGVFCLWHLWVIAGLCVLLAASIWRDAKALRKRP